MSTYQQIADAMAMDPTSPSRINYGQPPKIVKSYTVQSVPKAGEMMCYLYLPVSMKGSLDVRLPDNLKQYRDLINIVMDDSRELKSLSDLYNGYVYLTVKHLFVNPGNPGNREGWHADGFGSDGDLNYIMHSMNPTEFAVQHFGEISTNDAQSLIDMEAQIDHSKIMMWPDNALLRMDESIIHRVGPVKETGMRTFVKVSISKHKFNLKDNAHNYLFDYDWDMHIRSVVRNLDNKDEFNNKDHVS